MAILLLLRDHSAGAATPARPDMLDRPRYKLERPASQECDSHGGKMQRDRAAWADEPQNTADPESIRVCIRRSNPLGDAD